MIPELIPGSPSGQSIEFALAEIDAADLATDGLGQLGDEFDFARVFVRHGEPLDMLLEFARERRRGVKARREHDERFDDLTAHKVRTADDGRLGNRRMLE